jgi:hypothetical protein
MTDLELLEILERPASNLEKALAIRVLLKASQPSVLNIKPQVERKKRAVNKPKPAAVTPTSNGIDHDHEAQP